MVGGALVVAELTCASARAELTVIASESSPCTPRIADEPPAISASGVVAFVGAFGVSEPREQSGDRRDVFLGDGSTACARALGLDGISLDEITSVALGDTQVAFMARRAGTAAPEVRGAYLGPWPSGPFVPLHEGPDAPELGRGPTRWAEIAMSPNGTVAFSTLYDLFGALYRKRPNQALETMQVGPAERPGGLNIHRAYALDVSDHGVIALDAELFCDAAPWCRGVEHAVYRTAGPNETRDDVRIAAAANCGSVAINRAEECALACVDTLWLGDTAPFTATPAPLRIDVTRPEPALRVAIDESARVVFAKPSGVFVASTGGAPAAPVLQVGERLGDAELLDLMLGGMNARGQLALYARVRRPDGSDERLILRTSLSPRRDDE